MSELVNGRDLTLPLGERAALPSRASRDAIQRLFQVVHLNAGAAIASGQDRCLVQQVFEIRAREACRLGDDSLQIDTLGKRLATGVEGQDVAPGRRVRQIESNLAVKAAGSQQGR